MKANASGLLIWGDVGTGKSFFAGCIANALLEKGVPVLMTNFSRILNTLTVMHFEDRNQFINSLNRYSLLIIDDLGIERNSDFALEQVFNVIDCRYRSKKPLIITTNLTLSELNNAADIAHKRIYDRILERFISHWQWCYFLFIFITRNMPLSVIRNYSTRPEDFETKIARIRA